MPNMDPKRCPMPVQDPQVRAHNFEEVALGYTEEMAVTEAKRCLQCKHRPCVGGCPVAIDIPGFLKELAAGDVEASYKVLCRQTSLPAVCGRVCPQESQCEARCVRGIKGEPVAIGRLERFVADAMREKRAAEPMEDSAAGLAGRDALKTPEEQCPSPNGRKVAVVGAGPAGLTAAGDLAKLGYDVTVYEALHKLGGVLIYGIPEFRLPKAIVQSEVDALRELGVKFKTNILIGRTLTVDELFEMGNEAVFIGSGAGLPRFMNIPGEGLNGVYSANEFLTRVNLMGAWQKGSRTPIQRADKVAVVGGGNVAMDAARSALRLGAKEVYIVYRRSMEEMPARLEEVEHAEEEGIVFKTLTNPKEVLGDAEGLVCGLRCVQCALGEPDESGRRSPVEIEGSDFILDVDCVVMAIGTSPNPLILSTTPGLEANKKGCIVTRGEAGLTTRENVWAGGDVVSGAATVILAMGAGKNAAAQIDSTLRDSTV